MLLVGFLNPSMVFSMLNDQGKRKKLGNEWANLGLDQSGHFMTVKEWNLRWSLLRMKAQKLNLNKEEEKKEALDEH